jgi:hypothetical protein
MSTTLLNEHDANQGAQSKGEFLGMTGNSGWYLLGSAGTTVMLVIVLWGVFGISLLLCMLLGVVLCLLSVVYVFTLKNNKPDHYDTDFFESALIEAGLIELSFGPRSRRLANPFVGSQIVEETLATKRVTPKRESSHGQRANGGISATGLTNPPMESLVSTDKKSRLAKDEKEPVIALSKYEKLQSEFVEVEDRLEAALLEQEESGS